MKEKTKEVLKKASETIKRVLVGIAHPPIPKQKRASRVDTVMVSFEGPSLKPPDYLPSILPALPRHRRAGQVNRADLE